MLYGASLGMALDAARLQAEIELARARRAPGELTAGVGAVRARQALRLRNVGGLAIEAAISGALGVTWATGASNVPGTVVKSVLLPYADARLEVAVRLLNGTRFTPELGLYAGRAGGILAKADRDGVIATGGWLFGVSVGASL